MISKRYATALEEVNNKVVTRLQAENARLQEQNAQLVFATELLVKEINKLKEVKQEECPEITITP